MTDVAAVELGPDDADGYLERSRDFESWADPQVEKLDSLWRGGAAVLG